MVVVLCHGTNVLEFKIQKHEYGWNLRDMSNVFLGMYSVSGLDYDWKIIIYKLIQAT